MTQNSKATYKGSDQRGWIEREELLRLLDRSDNYALTLLLAPAGSGKSTLMMQWRARRANTGVASISLTRRDADPVHFFNRLDTAIRTVVPGYDGLSYNDLSAEVALPPEVLAEWLAEALTIIEQPLHILIDDFQLAESSLIHDVLAELLTQLPENIHLILASRTHPQFSLSRLKLDDRLLVIDRHDLRFSERDCEVFCARLCPDLNEDTRHRLWEVTEGWAAGVKLGMLAWSQGGHADSQVLSGNLPELVDYFARVVLHDLAPELNRFLLACSILERLSVPLCNDLLATQDSEAMIEAIRSRELFISPVEDRPGWWRLHPLFQEFLLARAQRTDDMDINGLHRRAADWYMDDGDEEMALHHAGQLEDQPYFESLLATCCDRWLHSGRFGAIIHWVLPLPEEAVQTNTDLSGPLIGALTLSRRFNQAQYFIDLVRHAPPSAQRGRFVHADGTYFQETMLQLFQHDTDFRVGADREALLSSAGHHDIRAFCLAILAYHYLLHAEFDNALHYAQRAKDTLAQMGYAYLESYADLILVLCDRNRGRMLHATQNVHLMYARYDDGSNGPAWVNAATAKVVVLYECNQLAEARQLCETLLPLVSSACATEIIASSYLTLIRILELEGNVMRSHRLTQHLERILKLGNYDRFHAQVIHEQMRQAYRSSDAERIDWLVAEYRLRERYAAGEWSKARHYDEEWERSGLAVAMWLQYQNQLARAEQVLHAVAETLRAQGANARAVVADANLVVIAWQGGDNELAFARLKQLVERYGIECLNRTALDEAPGLYQVIQHAASQQQVLLPPLYLEMFASVIARAAIVVEKPKEEERPVESLTEREKDILNLLRKGISNREIGELSGLAVTTIKWHIKNIFAKLGVTSRAEAIVMANRSPARFGIKEQRPERAS